MRSASNKLIIIKHTSYQRHKWRPIYLMFHKLKPIAQPFNFLVLFLQNKLVKTHINPPHIFMYLPTINYYLYLSFSTEIKSRNSKVRGYSKLSINFAKNRIPYP